MLLLAPAKSREACAVPKDTQAAELKLEGSLTKVHAVLMVTLQKAQQELPQVA